MKGLRGLREAEKKPGGKEEKRGQVGWGGGGVVWCVEAGVLRADPRPTSPPRAPTC